jgi:hypothetical protein
LNAKEMEAKIIALEDKITRLEDVEKIKNVQHAYGYYMDNLMYDEAADLFTDNCYAKFSGTTLQGREALKKSFNTFTTDRFEGTKKLFLKLQMMGTVTMDPSGKRAKARWNMVCFKTDYVDNKLESIVSHGVYEMEYAKEGEIWKADKLLFNSSFQTTLRDGWAARPTLQEPKPGTDKSWRSGFKLPISFKHPVTGK